MTALPALLAETVACWPGAKASAAVTQGGEASAELQALHASWQAWELKHRAAAAQLAASLQCQSCKALCVRACVCMYAVKVGSHLRQELARPRPGPWARVGSSGACPGCCCWLPSLPGHSSVQPPPRCCTARCGASAAKLGHVCVVQVTRQAESLCELMLLLLRHERRTWLRGRLHARSLLAASLPAHECRRSALTRPSEKICARQRSSLRSQVTPRKREVPGLPLRCSAPEPAGISPV